VAYTLVAPADGKHLDAILKLIQKPIDYLETGKAAQLAATDEGEDKPARPARSRRGGPRNRPEGDAGSEPAPAARPPAAKSAAAEDAGETAKVERSQRSSRGRGKQRPEAEKTDSDVDISSSPFGNDGPIPAFLLRPTRAAS
jgi:hypothetical protein